MLTDPIGININEPFSLVSKQEGVLDDITLKMMPTDFEICRLEVKVIKWQYNKLQSTA